MIKGAKREREREREMDEEKEKIERVKETIERITDTKTQYFINLLSRTVRRMLISGCVHIQRNSQLHRILSPSQQCYFNLKSHTKDIGLHEDKFR